MTGQVCEIMSSATCSMQTGMSLINSDKLGEKSVTSLCIFALGNTSCDCVIVVCAVSPIMPLSSGSINQTTAQIAPLRSLSPRLGERALFGDLQTPIPHSVSQASQRN